MLVVALGTTRRVGGVESGPNLSLSLSLSLSLTLSLSLRLSLSLTLSLTISLALAPTLSPIPTQTRTLFGAVPFDSNCIPQVLGLERRHLDHQRRVPAQRPPSRALSKADLGS